MRTAAHGFGFVWRYSAADTLRLLADQGFDSVELIAAPGHLDLWEPLNRVVPPLHRAMAASQVRVLAVDLLAHDINLACLWSEALEFTLDAYGRLIQLSAELGASWATVHGGRRIALNPPPDKRETEVLRGAFDRLAQTAQRHNIRLLIENIPIALLATGRQMTAFVDAGRWSNVDIAYDITNALAAGENIQAELPNLLPRLSVLHLSDAPKGLHRHDPIGSGDIDFAMLASSTGAFQGWSVIEIISEDLVTDFAVSRRALAEAGWPVDSRRHAV